MCFRNKCKNFDSIENSICFLVTLVDDLPCCSLEIFADQLGVPRLVVILTCSWKPGHLHVVRPRSLLISFAFSVLFAPESHGIQLGSRNTSHSLLQISSNWHFKFRDR